MARLRQHDEGFTLVELLMVVAITGIIMTAVASAFTVGLRTTDGTGIRLSESVDTQLLSAYLPQDVQSAGAGAGDLSVDPSADAGCSTAPGTNVLALRSTDADTGTTYGVTYRSLAAAGEHQLVRVSCGGTSEQTVIARSLAASSGAVADITQNPRVTMKLTTASGYTGTVSAVRRTVSMAPPITPPVSGGCTVVSASLDPSPGFVTPLGVLVPPPLLTVAVTGACGSMTARYAPDGSTSVTTALAGSGPYTALLQATGWTAGSRPVSVFSDTSALGVVPYQVVAAPTCVVTNLVATPSAAVRVSDPPPAPLATGAVTVKADFGPTCGTAVLVFDPLTSTTSPSAAQVDFVGTGTSKTATIPATTAWNDGDHTLVVEESGQALASRTFRVDSPCSVTSVTAVPDPVALANNNKHLSERVTVTVKTQSPCAALRVRFTPSATAVVRDLTESSPDTWTLSIKENDHDWTPGSKQLDVLRPDGSLFETSGNLAVQ